MTKTKTAAPVLAHRDGQNKELMQKLKLIVPLLRAAVKFAAVALGVYILAAVAALNWVAALAAILAENWLLGLYIRLAPREEVHTW